VRCGSEREGRERGAAPAISKAPLFGRGVIFFAKTPLVTRFAWLVESFVPLMEGFVQLVAFCEARSEF